MAATAAATAATSPWCGLGAALGGFGPFGYLGGRAFLNLGESHRGFIERHLVGRLAVSGTGHPRQLLARKGDKTPAGTRPGSARNTASGGSSGAALGSRDLLDALGATSSTPAPASPAAPALG